MYASDYKNSWALLSSLLLATVFLAHGIANCQERSVANWKTDYSIWFTTATGEENTNSLSEAQIFKGGFSLGRSIKHVPGAGWRTGDLEYSFSVASLFLQLGPQGRHGVGFEPVILRWNSHVGLGRATPYIELAGGGLRTNGNFPAGNTSNFNFTVRGGGGVYLRTKGREALDLGLGWSHISNANLGTQNPEFNGIELRIAYHWLR